EPSLGQIDDKDFSFVHELPEMEIYRWVRQHAVEPGVGQEGVDLVLNRRDGVLSVAWVVFGKLLGPEEPDLLIGHAADDLPSEGFVGEHSQNVRKLCALVFKEGKERLSENVLHALAPRVIPELLKGLHQAGGRERYPLRLHPAERVVS